MIRPCFDFRYPSILALLCLVLGTAVLNAQTPGPGNVIYFDLNVPTLNSAARATVGKLLSSHAINKDQKLLLYGYADYLGTRAHNDSLSTERAVNVRAYLVSKGIPAGNITICVGKGAEEPDVQAYGAV